MHQNDFVDFAALLRKLSEVFAKKLTDETTQAYWGALKDQPLSTVTRLVDQHTRYGKFFPKPVELRPKEDKPAVTRDSAGDAKFREGEARCVANLEELRHQDPIRWEHEVRARRNARILATAHPGSAEFEDARLADAALRWKAGWIGPCRITEPLPPWAAKRISHEG